MLLFCSCVQKLNMANFEVLEGRRTNSKVYIHEDYRYTVCKTYQEYQRLRCVEYKNFRCYGAATLKGNMINMIKGHNHAKDTLEITEMKVKTELKKAVGETDDNVRNVYDRVITKFSDEVKKLVTWKGVRSWLYSLRKKRPSTVEGGSSNRCDVCLLPADETWGFDPCGHYPFCSGCSDIILRNDQKCPICRKAVIKRIKLFHT